MNPAAESNARITGARVADTSITVVCLCAAWCGTCNEFRAAYDAIAYARPHVRFVWLDVEDDAQICGDVDVENFPTLVIYRGDALLHLGVSLPQQGSVARLIDEMATRTTGIDQVPEAIRALRASLAQN